MAHLILLPTTPLFNSSFGWLRWICFGGTFHDACLDSVCGSLYMEIVDGSS